MPADLLTQVILPLSLFIIMFGMGLSLKLNDFKCILKSKKAMTIGLIGQMLILPSIAFLIAIAFQLPPEISVGIIIIALAPGGATSNMFTYLSKGDVALSISLTAVVSLITPFSIPLITALSLDYFMGSGANIELPILKTITQLLGITIVPVILGMLFLARWENAAKKIENILKWFSIFFLFLIIILIIGKSFTDIMGFFMQIGLAVLLLNISVLLIGYLLAKWASLSHAQTVTIGFEIGIQNGTLAILVAGTLIGNITMTIPATVYGILMFFTGGGFSWWMNKIRKNQERK